MKPSSIRLAFYCSLDVPYIMIFGPLDVDLNTLTECFRRLSKEERCLDFDSLPFVYSSGKIKLRMCSVEDESKLNPISKLHVLNREDEECLSIEWVNSMLEWEYLIELLGGLLLSKRPGHQYLTQYPEDDAIVVVSKGEYDDEVLNK